MTSYAPGVSNPYPGGDVGLFYHQQSALGLSDLAGDVVDWGRRPDPYLERTPGTGVALPPPTDPPDITVAQALQQRRSLREYADREITLGEVAWLVHAATGITSAKGLRAAVCGVGPGDGRSNSGRLPIFWTTRPPSS